MRIFQSRLVPSLFLILGVQSSIVQGGGKPSSNHWGGLWSNEPLYIDDEYEMYIDELPHTLPPFAAYTNTYDHMDWAHDWIFLLTQRSVEWMDTLFIEKGEDPLPIPVSRFDIRLEIRHRDEVNEAEWDVEPDFNISVTLPNLEDTFQLYFTSTAVDQLPGLDPSEREADPRIGIRQKLGPFTPSFGLKVEAPPELYTNIKFQCAKEWRGVQFYPLQKFFWQSDTGFGMLGSIAFDKWSGRKLFRSLTAGTWGEETLGVEWKQSFLFMYARKMIREVLFERRAGGQDLAMGFGLRASVFGHKSGSGIIDRYRLTAPIKIPMWREWLYLVIAPELEFRNEDDWQSIPGVKFGFQGIFWNPELDDWTAY